MANPAASLQLLAPVRVWLRLLSGKYIPCPIFLSDTVFALGVALRLREPSVNLPAQPLFFGGRELNREQTLTACGIVEDSVLQLIPIGAKARDYPSWITVVTPSGRLRYGISQSETVDTFGERFWSAEGRPRSGFLFAGQPLPGGRTFGECGVSAGALLTVQA
jgi:hypothetical protein